MIIDLDNNLDLLSGQTPDHRLEQLEPRVWSRIETFQRSALARRARSRDRRLAGCAGMARPAPDFPHLVPIPN